MFTEKAVFDCMEANSSILLGNLMFEIISLVYDKQRQIVILCIGTDRSTGDSLGPLVGEKLKFLNNQHISVYGNLESPVHAKNLLQTIDDINNKFNDPYIIAIDACLGSLQNVGKIFIDNKPLNPGSAMNKKLPAIGNISITGVVNICGSLDFITLQNTRLFTVMKLAETISRGIYHSIILKKHYKDNPISNKKTSLHM